MPPFSWAAFAGATCDFLIAQPWVFGAVVLVGVVVAARCLARAVEG